MNSTYELPVPTNMPAELLALLKEKRHATLEAVTKIIGRKPDDTRRMYSRRWYNSHRPQHSKDGYGVTVSWSGKNTPGRLVDYWGQKVTTEFKSLVAVYLFTPERADEILEEPLSPWQEKVQAWCDAQGVDCFVNINI